ncbi:MAG: hypothetical protein ACNS60_14960 [Candidatus Cyclobacteriaceae bacterium M2_1C_046]
MKTHFFTTIIIFISSILFAQEQTNKLRIEEAKKEMEVAASKEDYTTAAQLQKEIEIRQQIEVEVSKGNYGEAQRLKELLNGGSEESTETIDYFKDFQDTSFELPYYENPGFYPPAEGKAVVYFTALHKGLGKRYDYFHNDEYIGRMDSGKGYLRVEVNPGNHLFGLPVSLKLLPQQILKQEKPI